MFLMLFGLSKTEYKSQLREVNGDLHKAFRFYVIVNYQLKTRELKNVEKLVKQTVQTLRSY